MKKVSSTSKESDSFKEKIKNFLAFNGITLKELVYRLNEAYPDSHTSAANIANKMSRGTIKFSEVEQMAEVLGYELEFVRKKSDENPSKLIERPEIYELEDGTVEADSFNFGKLVIIGENARDAAWYYLTECLKKGCPSRTQEGRIIDKVAKECDVRIERKF